MIKNLKSKVLICLFLFVILFSVTNSCFAAFNSGNVISSNELDIPLSGAFAYLSSLISSGSLSGIYNLNSYYVCYATRSGDYRFAFVALEDFKNLCIVYNEEQNSYYGLAYNSNGEHIKDFYKLDIFYNAENDSFMHTESLSGETCFSAQTSVIDNNYLRFVDNSTVNISYETLDNNIFFPIIVNVSHEFNSDTSAKVNFDIANVPAGAYLQYSLTGVEINADLTAPLKLKNPITYTIGITNLVVKPNTKVYWALYSLTGECLESDVYQVPVYDVQIENADKNIKYELKYSSDYTYATLNATLENGEFSDKLVYSEFSSLNISTGKLDYGYQNFSGSLKIITNGKYYFYAIDNLGNVFDTAVVTVTDIFNFQDSDFSYNIVNDSTLHGGYKLNITPKVNNWSSKVVVKYSISLTSGHQMATVAVDTEYPELSYVDSVIGTYCDDMSIGSPICFNGRIMSGDTIRIFSPSNNLDDLKGKITFKIYKKSDNSLVFDKTYTLEVSAFTSNNIVDGNSGNVSGSLPANSSNSSDFTNNDYGDVSWSDISSMISTDSSFWQIIKTILNCLPTWITAPIFFFISAVVTICLTKMIMSIVGHLVG